MASRSASRDEVSGSGLEALARGIARSLQPSTATALASTSNAVRSTFGVPLGRRQGIRLLGLLGFGFGFGENVPMAAHCIWHVTVDGVPACTSAAVPAEERLDPPFCAARDRERAEGYATRLRARLPGAEVAVVEDGCPMRGE
jgi:hypothetical protein